MGIFKPIYIFTTESACVLLSVQIFKPARDYAVVDVETSIMADGEIPKTLFWGYADSKGYEQFKTTRKLLAFLKQTSPKTLLHHSNFDVIQLLVDGVTDINILRSHHGKLIRCSLGNHYLQNTFTVFPVKLEKIFTAFGFKKTSLKNLAKRNYEDCVNGLHCFTELDARFLRIVGVSPLERGTVAGTTFRAAEKTAGTMPKDLRFLSSYRGGRVDVFNTTRRRCGNFDIHSSYPQSFLEVSGREVLLHVECKSTDWVGPMFDSSVSDMLLFPAGTFRSYIFESNFERYIRPNSSGVSIKILSRHPINFEWICRLQGLIETIYHEKQTSPDAGIVECCKFLLNAFYGRIGLKGETERARILDYEPDGDDVTTWRLSAKKFLCFDTVERETRSNYPFAAFITDNARCRLFEALVKNNAFYCDTDSIFTPICKDDFTGNTGNDLGQWGFKGRKVFRARSVKDYEWGDEEVLKGGHSHIIWTLKQFASGKTAALIERQRRSPLRKRVILPSGKTDPIVVNKKRK
jgi:hypothetical protein